MLFEVVIWDGAPTNDGPALPPDEHFLKTQLAVRH